MRYLIFLFFFLHSYEVFAQKTIIFLGDSLTEGYGVTKEEAYPALIQAKLEKLYPKKYRVINGGISGSTTASGPSRMRWFFKAHPYVIVLALGANDGLRGIKVSESEKNLSQVIKMAQDKKIKIILCEMHLPTNYGKEYRKQFNDMFKKIHKKYKVPLIPFMLEGVGGIKKMNIEDGIHPNAKGHQKVADNILKYLEKYL